MELYVCIVCVQHNWCFAFQNSFLYQWNLNHSCAVIQKHWKHICTFGWYEVKCEAIAIFRYRFPDEDFNSELHHHHPAALGHCRPGEVRYEALRCKISHQIINYVCDTVDLFTDVANRYRSLTEQYFRKADGILAMYDVTQPASFIAVRGWIDSVKVSCWSYHGWTDVKTCKLIIWMHMQAVEEKGVVGIPVDTSNILMMSQFESAFYYCSPCELTVW